MYFIKSCISSNHVFHQIMYFIKSCISSNHVFHHIMYFIKSCISPNQIMYFTRVCFSFGMRHSWSCVSPKRTHTGRSSRHGRTRCDLRSSLEQTAGGFRSPSSPPSLRRLLPAYRPLVLSTIMRARRQVQRVRDEKSPAVAAPPTSSVPPPGSEHHYVCSETGTASTR